MRLHLNTVSPETSRHSYIQSSEVVEYSDPTFRPIVMPTIVKKTSTSTPHLGIGESIDHLCINNIG